MSQPNAFVYADLHGVPALVGRLWSTKGKTSDTATFEYDAGWLVHPQRFPLEPALTLDAGQHHTGAGKALFGALGDSAPDRWGRSLLARAERRRAIAEGRAPRTLHEIDYLLGVADEARLGALRFSETVGGPFLAENSGDRVPPLISLPRLLAASLHLEADQDTDEDLRLLLAPGSSLGGARPKASVRDTQSRLLIAKFPSKDDTTSVTRWEAVALRLAQMAGIQVPASRLQAVDGNAVLLVKRFDREANARIPFLSAMSMLGTRDMETHSYLEIADALRSYGGATLEDTHALWRRMVFNILISNADDHLRNHGFLYDGHAGWRLSPAYDMNPVPVDIKAHMLTTTIGNDGDPTASIALAMEVGDSFALKVGEARSIVAEVASATSAWRRIGRQRGISPREIDRMASAFDHAELALARKM